MESEECKNITLEAQERWVEQPVVVLVPSGFVQNPGVCSGFLKKHI